MKQIVDGVYSVGVKDWNLPFFHGYEFALQRGTTYNSFLIKDEKVALLDTVWAPFTEMFVDNIKEVVDFSELDYVVANHLEPDHSGALPKIMELAPQAKIVVSQKGLAGFKKYYQKDWDYIVVKTGDKLSLGENDLIFVEAPMLHWPDTMMTYLTGKNILFSNDAFGQHYASSGIFNDEEPSEIIYHEALNYYVNILAPYVGLIPPKVKELQGFNLPIDMIAPSHGVIWRDNPMQIVEAYVDWATSKGKKEAVIVYSSMWGSTEQMAHAVAKGLEEVGVPYKLRSISHYDKNTLLMEIFQVQGLILGSSTFNNLPLSSMAAILEDIKGYRFKNKIAAAFGSYGWSGEALTILEEHLKKSKFEVPVEGVKCMYRATPEELEACVKLGREFGENLLKRD